jgi:short-subunit dehydrogenase
MKNTVALITGACSGIGFELAKMLGMRGYALLLVSQNEEGLRQAKSRLHAENILRMETCCINLAEFDAATRLFEFCSARQWEVEVLVNNAGFFFFGEIARADVAKASAMIQLHVHTSALLCTLFSAEMKKRKRGFILNTSSISVYKPFPGIGYYAGTKTFIRYFTRSLRTELRMHGIQVTCLLPGATATNLYDPNVINVELGKKWGIMMDASQVARAGLNALFSDKAEVVPGLMTKMMLFFTLLTPQWIIYQIRKRWKTLN